MCAEGDCLGAAAHGGLVGCSCQDPLLIRAARFGDIEEVLAAMAYGTRCLGSAATCQGA